MSIAKTKSGHRYVRHPDEGSVVSECSDPDELWVGDALLNREEVGSVLTEEQRIGSLDFSWLFIHLVSGIKYLIKARAR